MINSIKKRINNITYLEEKKRILKIGILLLVILFSAFILLNKSFALYKSEVKMNIKVDRALYLVGVEKMAFNIDSSKIVPSDTPYIYNFSISNFTNNSQSDIDLEYNLIIKTTTNLPLTIELYRDNNTTKNILNNVKVLQDEDGSWYRIYEVNSKEVMLYKNKVTNLYTLKVLFPASYNSDLTYADCIENIEVIINSNQIVN